jgi:hypothetical protein
MAITNDFPLARAGALLSIAAGLLAISSVATSQVSDSPRAMTVAGCLVTEREYAIARGLARPTTSGDTQLVVVLPKEAVRATVLDGLALTGRQEAALVRDAGRRITLEGVLEPSLTASTVLTAREPLDDADSPTGAVGTTPGGSPAHEPSDAATLTAAVADGGPRSAEAGLRDRASSIADLSRLNVTAARDAGERCELEIAPVPVNTTIDSPRPVTPRTAGRETGAPITVIGCLVREEVPDGSYLAVVGAVTGTGTSRPQGSAVPGSSPSGANSGTIGTGGASSSAVQPWAFRLVTTDPAVGRRVGQRVEVVGVVERVDVAAGPTQNATTGHTTAPTRQIRVTSVRAASGSCQ